MVENTEAVVDLSPVVTGCFWELCNVKGGFNTGGGDELVRIFGNVRRAVW